MPHQVGILITLIVVHSFTYEPNIFLPWTQLFASFKKNQSSCWVCGQLPMSNTPSLSWWLSLRQGSSWMALTNFTLGERDSSTMQANATANITE